MTGRKMVLSLLPLCALAFCALAVPSASAEGTTAFTCAPTSEAKFSDEHCTTAGTGTGFKHTEIAAGTATEFAGSNEKTASATKSAQPVTMHMSFFGITVVITCKKVSSVGSLMNAVGPPMKASGSATVTYTECETIFDGTIKKCKVKEPVVWNENLTTVAEGSEMYVKAEGSGAGGVFGAITFENNPEGCPKALTTNPFSAKGTAIGTPNGATLEFKEKEPHSTLSVGGNPVDLTLIETLRKKGGSPIAFTTTAT